MPVSDRQVRLADCEWPEQDAVVSLVDVRARRQVFERVLAQGVLMVNVEVLKRLHLRAVRCASTDLDAGGLPVGDLAAQDGGQVFLLGSALPTGGIGEVGEHTRDGRGLECPGCVGDLERGVLAHADTSESSAALPTKSTS